jgi:hypothetical protein
MKLPTDLFPHSRQGRSVIRRAYDVLNTLSDWPRILIAFPKPLLYAMTIFLCPAEAADFFQLHSAGVEKVENSSVEHTGESGAAHKISNFVVHREEFLLPVVGGDLGRGVAYSAALARRWRHQCCG